MILKLCSIALITATAASAQTTSRTTKPTTHHTSTAHHTATTASKIPHVPGIPKTLYALKYIDITIGKGPLAQPDKWTTVHYTGWLLDGTKFDSSYDHPGSQPITFPYGAHRVIYGWDTGFEGMHVGGKRRLFIPYQLAYGADGRPPKIPAKAELIFDVELLGQSDTPPEAPRPPAPKPEAAPANSTQPAAKPATEAPNPAPETKPAEPESKPKTANPQGL